MTYIETLNMIKNLADEQPMVNSTAIGDVYKISVSGKVTTLFG